MLAVIGGVVFCLDWIGSDGFWCTWISMALLWWTSQQLSVYRAAFFGLIFGFIGLGCSFWWAQDMLAYVMNQEGWSPKAVFAGLILWESLLFAVFAAAIAATRSSTLFCRWMIPICLWVVVEGFWPRVFRWTLGHSQFGWLALVQAANLGGASLVSALVLFLSSLPSLLIDRFANRKLDPSGSSIYRIVGLAGLVLMLWFGYGCFRVYLPLMVGANRIAVGVVQGDPDDREAVASMSKLSSELGPVDLLVWPESTLGVHSLELPSFADEDLVLEHSRPPMLPDPIPLTRLSCPLIVGGRSFQEESLHAQSIYQTAFLISPGGSISDRYHKRSLMPLGEYVPGEASFPWLHDLFQLGDYFLAGQSDAPFVLHDGTRVGAIICYEDTMSEVVRRTVAAGAEFLVCIVNDSAFQSPIALAQHRKLARMRTIENRRWLIRSTGGGITCSIDDCGRLINEMETQSAGAFKSQVHRLSTITLFQQFGEWPKWISAVVLIAWGIACSRSKSSRGSGELITRESFAQV
jgi:apolipoprotein N-acyltransferase